MFKSIKYKAWAFLNKLLDFCNTKREKINFSKEYLTKLKKKNHSQVNEEILFFCQEYPHSKGANFGFSMVWGGAIQSIKVPSINTEN